MSRTPTSETAAPNKSGRWVSAAPINNPPFDTPTMAIFPALGVFHLDQGLGGSNKIIKHVLLVFLHPCLMPPPAIFSAAAQIWESKNTPLLIQLA